MVPQPRSPTQTLVVDKTIHKERGDNVERATTTGTSLDAEQGSGNINRTQSMAIPNDPFPQGIGSGGSPSLETDLKQTKQIYGAAYTRLIKKVIKLEKIVKSSQARRRARIVVSDDEDDLEDPSKKGRKIAEIDQDPGISLVQHDAEIQGRYGHDMEFDFDFDAAKEVFTAGAVVTTASVDVSTVSPTRNTRVPTVDDITMVETMVYIRKSVVKDKGKSKMDESKTIQTKIKLQQEQERLGFEVAVRLQVELEEEERQRIAMRLQAEEREKYTEAEQVRMLAELINQRKSEVDRAVPKLAVGSSKRAAEEELDQESSKTQKTDEGLELAKEPRDKEADELSQEELQQMMIIVPEQGMNFEALQTKYLIIDWEIYTKGTKTYWKIIIVGNHTKVHHFFDDMPKSFDKDGLVTLWSLVKEKFNSTEPTDDKERDIWVKLKRLFEPNTNDELWKLQKHIHDLTWRQYDSCGVHHVSTEKGIDIYMLVEKEYPLSRGTLTLMLVTKLLVDQDNEMSKELLRKIFMQVERPRR
ncbi:hypothetical protein Tco_0855883 [Tanacetum coccineum]